MSTHVAALKPMAALKPENAARQYPTSEFGRMLKTLFKSCNGCL